MPVVVSLLAKTEVLPPLFDLLPVLSTATQTPTLLDCLPSMDAGSERSMDGAQLLALAANCDDRISHVCPIIKSVFLVRTMLIALDILYTTVPIFVFISTSCIAEWGVHGAAPRCARSLCVL